MTQANFKHSSPKPVFSDRPNLNTSIYSHCRQNERIPVDIMTILITHLSLSSMWPIFSRQCHQNVTSLRLALLFYASEICNSGSAIADTLRCRILLILQLDNVSTMIRQKSLTLIERTDRLCRVNVSFLGKRTTAVWEISLFEWRSQGACSREKSEGRLRECDTPEFP